MRKLYNLREYHRPGDLDEVRRLLKRRNVRTVVLAGGIAVIGEGTPQIEAVVDLDGLKLDFIEHEAGTLRLGAMLRLQTLIERLADSADGLLAETSRRTAGLHIRNQATVGGLLAGGEIHVPLSVALAALRARVMLHGQSGEPPLWADLAGDIRAGGIKRRLITAVSIDLPGGRLGACYEQVARTPADRPIVSAAAVAYKTSSGAIEATMAVGGLLHDLVVVTQTVAPERQADAIEAVMRAIDAPHTINAFQSDFLGGADYRRSMASVLTRRALSGALDRLGAPSSGVS